jgi:hypothetical protein
MGLDSAAPTEVAVEWVMLVGRADARNCFDWAYVEKLMARAGTTPMRVGPRPLNNARGPSWT